MAYMYVLRCEPIYFFTNINSKNTKINVAIIIHTKSVEFTLSVHISEKNLES